MNRLSISLICLIFFQSVSAQTIKKCQDEEGKWHYGDHAAEECARSRITEIHQSGQHLKQIGVPPTKEEVDAKRRLKTRLAEQKKLEFKQKQLDERLLSTYESADSIVRTRDALLTSIDSYIQTEQGFKQRLEQKLSELEPQPGEDEDKMAIELRAQIQEYEESIRNRLATRESVRVRYENELNRYQQLVNKGQ